MLLTYTSVIREIRFMPNSRPRELNPYTVVSFCLLVIAVFGTASLLLRGTLDNRSKATVAPIALVNTYAGGSSNSKTVSVAAQPGGNLYVASITMKSWRPTASVQGLGLQWTRLKSQCGARSSTGVDVWTAVGTPTSGGTVTATFDKEPTNAEMTVSVFANAAQSNTVIDVSGINTKGENADCAGGTDRAAYSADVHAVANSISYAVLAERLRTNKVAGDFTQVGEFYQGDSNPGDKAGLAVMMNSTSVSGVKKLTGTLSSATDWALVKFVVQGATDASIPTPTPAPTVKPSSTPGSTTIPGSSSTPAPTVAPNPNPSSASLWISREEIAKLPTSGAAWDDLLKNAQPDAEPDFGNQDTKSDTTTVANAFVYARTGDRKYGDRVVASIRKIVDPSYLNYNPKNSPSNSSNWDWLGILRGLGSYPIAASLIDLKTYDPNTDQLFRTWLKQAVRAVAEGVRGSVVSAQEERPNNFGTHGAASRIAVDLYLGDTADLDKAITIFKGYLGEKGYSNSPAYKFGSLWWQADESHPMGINPKGATKNGHDIDGVLPDDQRRSVDAGKQCEGFVWPPCKTTYEWEGMQGNLVAAELLYHAGYPSYDWGDQAIRRAVDWLYRTTFADGKNYPAEGDDLWQVWIINKRYHTTYPTKIGGTPGKMMGYADWTHQ